MRDTLFLDLQDTWNVVQWNIVLVAKTKIEKKSYLSYYPSAYPLNTSQKSHGLTPLTYVEQDNAASIKLFTGLGFERSHEASWLLNTRDQ